MRRYLVIFSLFSLLSSLCFAQDTLVYTTGQKTGVKVIFANINKVIYTIPPDKKEQYVSQTQIAYIKLGDGSIYSKTIQAKADSIKNPNYRPITINAGVGASFMELAVPNYNYISGGGDPDFLTESAAYNFTVDYRFVKECSIGFGLAYQWFTDHPGYGQSETDYSETEKISRYNISGLFLYHFAKDKREDGYFGARIGESIWTDQIISNIANTIAPPIEYETIGAQSMKRLSWQVVAGYRAFIYRGLGIELEGGIGTPYLLEIGLTFRFKTKK